MSNVSIGDSRVRIGSTPSNQVIKTVEGVTRVVSDTSIKSYINPNTIKLTLGKLGVDSENNPPGPPPIPVTNGLIARYNASSWNSSTSTWEDLVGTYHATDIKGTISVGTSARGGDTVIYGGTNDGIRFPSGILPSTFTLFHLTRYRDGSRGRIITGYNNNWLDGHHGDKAGCAYHEGWIANSGTDVFGYDWVLSTSQNSLYRGEGTTYGTSGGSASTALSVNYGIYSEYSDWEILEILVYDRHLSSAEYQSVEGWIAALYPNSTTVTPSVSGNYVGYTAVSTQEQIYNLDPNYTLPVKPIMNIQRVNSFKTYLNTAIQGLKTRIQSISRISDYELDDGLGITLTNTRTIQSNVSASGGGETSNNEVVTTSTLKQIWY